MKLENRIFKQPSPAASLFDDERIQNFVAATFIGKNFGAGIWIISR
jgi:hypothetical protein